MSTESTPSLEELEASIQDINERRRLHWLWLLLQDDRQRHRLLFGMGLAVIATIAVMAYLTYSLHLLPLDLDTTLALQGIRLYPFFRLMLLVSRIGYAPWNILTVTLGCLIVARWLGWRHGAFLALVTLAQGLSNHLIKSAISRPRPTDNLVEVFLVSPGLSFPSGHVMMYTVFFGFLFFLIWTRLTHHFLRLFALVLTGGLVVLVGPSRIYLGAHWLSDVVAAHLLGLVILLFAIEFYVTHFGPLPSRRGRG